MYVRDARNRDEAWLLDHIEEMDLDDAAFRSRDYVIAVDEQTNERAGFGRLRIHKSEGEQACEITSIGVLEGLRGDGVRAHVVERLVENARDQGFEELFAFVEYPDYLAQFGFERVPERDLPDHLGARLAEKREGPAPDATPVRLAVDRFEMPDEHREAFKRAGAAGNDGEPEPETAPEDFGIDPDTATYKYDTDG